MTYLHALPSLYKKKISSGMSEIFNCRHLPDYFEARGVPSFLKLSLAHPQRSNVELFEFLVEELSNRNITVEELMDVLQDPFIGANSVALYITKECNIATVSR
jgi:hypothetical protein